MLIPRSDAIPADHFVHVALRVPGIDFRDVGSIETECIDVTTVYDEYRRFVPGLCTVRSHNGSVLMGSSPDIVQAAIRGGGDYLDIYPNPPYTVESLPEHNARLAREVEESRFDADSWEWE